MTYVSARIPSLAITCGALLFAAPAVAGGVAAGTLIENTASASFTTPSGTQTVASNTVSVLVDELLDAALVSQDSGALPIASGEAVLSFRLTNLGNGPEAYRLAANPVVAGNDFTVTITGIAYDLDGNGIYDPAIDELLGAGEATPVLAADGSLPVFVLVSAPAAIADGALSAVSLRAEAVTGTGVPGTFFAGEGEGGGDAVVGLTQAAAEGEGSLVAAVVAVSLVKSAIVTDPFGGAEAVPQAIVTYTLTASVSGTGTVEALAITDAIPAGTTYRAGTLLLDGTALSDVADSDAGAAGSTGIAVDLGDVAAGATHTIAFSVTID